MGRRQFMNLLTFGSVTGVALGALYPVVNYFIPPRAAGGGGGTTAKRPYGLWVHGRYDVTGAVRAVTSIVQALDWKQSAEVLEVVGDVDEAALESATELGGTLAALLA